MAKIKNISNYINQLVSKYKLNLSGLTVLTEAASGSYLYNPLIAAEAGAKAVYTFCRDTQYGKTKDIGKKMLSLSETQGRSNSIKFITRKDAGIIIKADIVTNSGHLRPFTKEFMSKMKPTAVIPLMWEPWELRDTEIDIIAAKERGILIMGTNEHEPPCDMRPYSPMTALKLMMDHQTSIIDDNILIVGNQETLAIAIEDKFVSMGLKCKRIETTVNIDQITDAIEWASYILIAEHSDNKLLIGEDALMSISDLIETGIEAVGVISGQVDLEGLVSAGVSVFPKQLAPVGYMSFQPSELGPYPVMDLFTAGLKVGEAMARARMMGLSQHDAALEAIQKSPAMDLEGEMAWL